MGSDIDADLNRAFEIHAEDVLKVDVCDEFLDGRGALGLDSTDAAGKGIEFAGDDVTIHGVDG
jgi:hypothetical protein